MQLLAKIEDKICFETTRSDIRGLLSEQKENTQFGFSPTASMFGVEEYIRSMDKSEKLGLGRVFDKSIHPTATRYLENAMLKKSFGELARKWKDETKFFSSSEKITNHPAYKKIIEMGYDALPLILNDLDKEPHHWFVALYEITKQDPVPANDLGKIKIMAQHWLNWARQNGYEW